MANISIPLFLGLGLLILSLLRTKGIVLLEINYLLALAMTGSIFALADLFQFLEDISDKLNYWRYITLPIKIIKNLLRFFAIASFIVIPHLTNIRHLKQTNIELINDITLLLSLASIFVLIALKNVEKYSIRNKSNQT